MQTTVETKNTSINGKSGSCNSLWLYWGGGGGGRGGIQHLQRLSTDYSVRGNDFGTKDLIHDTRHLWTRFRIDGIKAMPRGISGGMREIAVDFVYALKTNLSFDKINVIIAFSEDIYGRYCIKKVTMITSTDNLPLSSLI